MTEGVGGSCVNVPLEATKSSLGTMLVSQTSFACKGGSPLHVGLSCDFLFSRGDALFGPAGLELLEHADGGILVEAIALHHSSRKALWKGETKECRNAWRWHFGSA